MADPIEIIPSSIPATFKLDVLRHMIAKGSPFELVTACYYTTGAAESIQAAFRRYRVKERRSIAPEQKSIYEKAKIHRFKPLSEPLNNEDFYEHLRLKVSENNYHEIDFNHRLFTQSLLGALRANAITMNQMLTIKLMYESLFCFNQGQMPENPVDHFKRFDLKDGPYDPSLSISYWQPIHSQKLAQEDLHKLHYYTIDIPHHQAVLYLKHQLENPSQFPMNDDLIQLILRYLEHCSHKLKIRYKHDSDLFLWIRDLESLQATVDTEHGLRSTENGIRKEVILKILRLIRRVESDEIWWFSLRKIYDHPDAILKFDEKKLIHEYASAVFIAALKKPESQIPLLTYFKKTEENPLPPLLSFVLPTIDTLNTLQHILHGNESTMPLATVGAESVRQIRGLDEIPDNSFSLIRFADTDAFDSEHFTKVRSKALLISHQGQLYYRKKGGDKAICLDTIAKKPTQIDELAIGVYIQPNSCTRKWVAMHTQHYTEAQKVMIDIYPFLMQVDSPSRPIEITHPDAPKTKDPHKFPCYNFLLTWHDLFHSWRNGENFKDVFRRGRHLHDTKGGFAQTINGMSKTIWLLSDIDSSAGRILRSSRKYPNRTRVLTILQMFRIQFGYDFQAIKDDNYLLIHDIIKHPTEWKSLLFDLDILTELDDVPEFPYSWETIEQKNSFSSLAARMKRYMTSNPDAPVVEVILHDLLAPLTKEDNSLFDYLRENHFNCFTWSSNLGVFFKDEKITAENALRNTAPETIRFKLRALQIKYSEEKKRNDIEKSLKTLYPYAESLPIRTSIDAICSNIAQTRVSIDQSSSTLAELQQMIENLKLHVDCFEGRTISIAIERVRWFLNIFTFMITMGQVSNKNYLAEALINRSFFIQKPKSEAEKIEISEAISNLNLIKK
mgnify:CR=1 FL=1